MWSLASTMFGSHSLAFRMWSLASTMCGSHLFPSGEQQASSGPSKRSRKALLIASGPAVALPLTDVPRQSAIRRYSAHRLINIPKTINFILTLDFILTQDVPMVQSRLYAVVVARTVVLWQETKSWMGMASSIENVSAQRSSFIKTT